MTQLPIRCDHGVPLSRLCLCCGEPSLDWMDLVAAGVYDAEGFTQAERRAYERKQAKR